MKWTRRIFLQSLGASMAVVAGCGSDTELDRRPNILLLTTDDQRSDMFGEGGNKFIGTPNIDRLAREGVLFENNFVTTSICPVSRASLFTGLYARCHGIHGFHMPLSEEQHALSYPVRLRGAGYRTGFVGKYGFGHRYIEDTATRFEWFKGWAGQGRYLVPGRPHMTEHIGNQALEFLETCSDEQPWNLSVSFKAPHVQDKVAPYFINDPRYDDLYEGLRLPSPPHMDGWYYDSLPEFLRSSTENRIRYERRLDSPQKWERAVKGYYALIHGVDVQIGRILEKIDSMSQLHETAVIFTSDNGLFLGERGWSGKWYMHEESIRTPMIIRDPRASETAGTRRREMTLNIDVCPTILSLAGLEIPGCMNGRDLTPLVRNENRDWRQEWFYEHLLEHPGIPKNEGIRRADLKYFVFPESDPLWEEMYALDVDPRETVNLARIPGHEEALAEMRQRRRVWVGNLESWRIDRTWSEPA